jgi:hypothetical protein
VDELIDMFCVRVLDCEVIDNEGKLDWFRGVAPESWGMAALIPAMFGESIFQEVVDQFACLGSSIHPLVDPNENMFVVLDFAKLVFLDDFRWNEVDRDPHVLRSFHGRVEIEVFDVAARHSHIGRG